MLLCHFFVAGLLATQRVVLLITSVESTVSKRLAVRLRLLIMAVHSLIETLEDQVCELALHKLEVNVLKDAARFSLHNTDVVHTT